MAWMRVSWFCVLSQVEAFAITRPGDSCWMWCRNVKNETALARELGSWPPPPRLRWFSLWVSKLASPFPFTLRTSISCESIHRQILPIAIYLVTLHSFWCLVSSVASSDIVHHQLCYLAVSVYGVSLLFNLGDFFISKLGMWLCIKCKCSCTRVTPQTGISSVSLVFS